MGKRYGWLSLGLAAFLLLQGCTVLRATPQGEQQAARIVTEVTIQYAEKEKSTKTYTKPEKIKVVLDYLQALILADTTTAPPEEEQETAVTICLQYSNGETKTYAIAGDEYLREGEQDWRKLEAPPEKGLESILQSNPSDAT